MDGCLGIGVAFQINICGSIREAECGLHESTEYGKVVHPDKVDEQCLGANAPGVAGSSGLVTQRDCHEGVSIMGIVPE